MFWVKGVGVLVLLLVLFGDGVMLFWVVLGLFGGLWGSWLVLYLWCWVCSEFEDGCYCYLCEYW